MSQSELANILKTHRKDEMISWVKKHPEHFDELIDLALSDEYIFAKRASFLLWSCIEKNDQRIKKNIERIMRSISIQPADHQRELLKVLLNIEIPEEYIAFLFDLSQMLWEKISLNPSIRICALKMMIKIANQYPELKNEINSLSDEQYLQNFSHAARKSVLVILNKKSC